MISGGQYFFAVLFPAQKNNAALNGVISLFSDLKSCW